MAKSLEQYTAEATQAYLPSQQAIQSQLGALDAQLNTANEKINRNYAQQQNQLNDQKNAAAWSASLQAAGSGGSFGGAANLANRRYYKQSFVPAQTQLQTNQANELASARQNYENQRTNLNTQLANLQAQANQEALRQYWAEVEAEKNRAASLAAARASAAAANPYKYLDDGYGKQSSRGYTLASERNQYGGFDWTDPNGKLTRAGSVAAGLGGDFNSSLASVLSAAARQGDAYSQNVLNELNNGYRFELNKAGNTGNAWYDTLGIKKVYTPTTTTKSSSNKNLIWT